MVDPLQSYASHLLDGKINLKSLLPQEMEQLMLDLGQPRYKWQQVWRWIYVRLVDDFEEMTDLSKDFRRRLSELTCVPSMALHLHQQSSAQDTDKFLFKMRDGSLVESVKMRYLESVGHGRIAICISSQVGCAMACSFCASGLAGLQRNLAAWEIADQVTQIQKAVQPLGQRVANVVYMGIGEPFHNYDNVMRSVRMINCGEGLGIGMRHLTISTSGLVPQIRQLAAERLPIRLAISLHATNDALRDEMMPVNRKWPISELLAACREYQQATERRITFEYVLLEGVNDSLAEAEALGKMLRGLHVLVNLIPWNPVEGASYQRSRPGRIRAFQERVEAFGPKCTVRQEKGADIDAACGQLRLRDMEGTARTRPARASRKSDQAHK
ncbi:23S rRNA (adenine(2503)-C(2))-methyltransferase RlmN [bacterium]|nr:23S rRNA (adenine(2503)-C(2))-methyltransferase RlmN [bacterium]